MKDYNRISNEKAYQLLNSGAMVLISTVDKNGKQDIAPIAWQCPVDYDQATRLLFVTDKTHQTFTNVEETRQFAISIPHIDQLELVKKLGSCSGADTDKIRKFEVQTEACEVIQCLVPSDCIGYVECKVYKIVDDKDVAIVFGEAVFAKADKEAFNNRILTEIEGGKVIHHVGGKLFYTASDAIRK
jgi:flavin reductase (DIM6/NTAB) family NADH-FMN oxidoreductase RutF